MRFAIIIEKGTQCDIFPTISTHYIGILRQEVIPIGDYSVIADVSASLVKLLRENMTPDPIPQPEMIGLASPVDKGISTYLFICTTFGRAAIIVRPI